MRDDVTIPDGPTFAAVIANWNGEAFIERCLASVLAAARETGRSIEVVVYDDASADRSPEMIAASFPSVRLIRGKRNVGYGAAVNCALAQTDADWIFLLNNDLALQTDYMSRLLRTLEELDGPVLAIGARTQDWDTGAVNHGGQRAAMEGGLIVQRPFESEAVEPVDFFQAGACLLNRRRFLELGGFASLFHPGYWEDYDIAWQGRQRGWGVYYEPRAVAWHLGKGSMRRLLGDYGLSLALRRNHLLFNWVNLRGAGELARHFFALPGLVARDRAGANEAAWGRALLGAIARLPAVLAERRRRTARLISKPS